MDVHFDYGEKYVSFQKIDTLIEASVDAFVLAENYGIEWLKELIRKLNIPTFSFQSSNNQSWSRCCNNWFLSASSIGTSENSCCSSDLQHLPFKGLPFQYKEAITCKVSGCLLDEGKRAKIKIDNEETFIVTVSKLNEKNVSLKYFKNETEYDTVIEYEKIFSSNTHITMLNCTFEMPEILDIDEFNGTQTFNTHVTQNDIIICYFNETLIEKMCGNFWVGQNIIILDAHQSETLGTITRIFPNFNQIYAKVSDIVRTFSFNQLKQYNSQMFDRKICYDNIFISLKQMPLKAINIETFNRSLAMSKIFQIGQKINAEPLVDDNSNIKVATIIQLSKVFVKVKDDKSVN
uniref:Uncharacterized protein n=1 Tax=Panagrolaimus superbus TaxID=310955 RepID=A0A914YCG4_9BILA